MLTITRTVRRKGGIKVTTHALDELPAHIIALFIDPKTTTVIIQSGTYDSVTYVLGER